MEARHLPDKKADGNFVTLVRLGHICIVPKNGSRRTKALTTSHFVKSYVTRKHLEEAMEAHKDAADELKKWRRTPDSCPMALIAGSEKHLQGC
jgi:hypothetical protein